MIKQIVVTLLLALPLTACETYEAPSELLEQYERSGNLEASLATCGEMNIPSLPDVKSAWIFEEQGRTVIQFSNLGLSCRENIAIPEANEERPVDCDLPEPAWWNQVYTTLPAIADLVPGEYLFQPSPDDPKQGAVHTALVVSPGARACGIGNVGGPASSGVLKIVIESVSPTCVTGSIEGITQVEGTFDGVKYSFGPNGRFVAQPC